MYTQPHNRSGRDAANELEAIVTILRPFSESAFPIQANSCQRSLPKLSGTSRAMDFSVCIFHKNLLPCQAQSAEIVQDAQAGAVGQYSPGPLPSRFFILAVKKPRIETSSETESIRCRMKHTSSIPQNDYSGGSIAQTT
jgi:hypothetical protein